MIFLKMEKWNLSVVCL